MSLKCLYEAAYKAQNMYHGYMKARSVWKTLCPWPTQLGHRVTAKVTTSTEFMSGEAT